MEIHGEVGGGGWVGLKGIQKWFSVSPSTCVLSSKGKKGSIQFLNETTLGLGGSIFLILGRGRVDIEPDCHAY